MPPSPRMVEDYLHEVLGSARTAAQPWSRATELPYFLQDAFRFFELELLAHPVVLAISNSDLPPPLSELRVWLDKVRAVASQPVIYVTQALASYERRRLIEHKVPFVVPGNQLYLPDLGLDLREHFRQHRTTPAALSPATQAILIAALLKQPWQAEWQPSLIATQLGYTPMTLSRAVKELTAAKLATTRTVHRARWLLMEQSAQQIWEQARPMLRTPVKRTVWGATAEMRISPAQRFRSAGLSALATHSMLVPPAWPVCAVSVEEWRSALDTGIQEVAQPGEGVSEWQVWSYSPSLWADAATVDPLSLTLSLQDTSDERVQLALEELKRHFPWSEG
jgi:DNA-binding MarR family transcriptional regulator